MDPENASENLPEEPPEGLTDRYKRKLRRLSEVVSKLLESTISKLKTALRPALDSIKHLLRKLLETKNSLSKWFDAKKDKLRKVRRGLIIWVISVAIVSMIATITNFVMEKQQTAGRRIWRLERQLEVTTEEKVEAENKLKEIASLRDRLSNLFEEKQLRTVIEKKRIVENKLKGTIAQLEKTVGQLRGMGQSEERLANNLEEITRLKKDLAEQLQTQRSINELLGWGKPEAAIPAAKKTTVEDTRKIEPGLEIPLRPGFFKKSTLSVVFGIALVAITGLCFFGARGQWLKKLFKKRVSEDQLHKFEHLENVSFTLLGGFLLEGFVKMGYEVAASSGITSGRLTCALKRENEKALFRYIICKEDNFGQGYIEDFANSMEVEKASKGYLVTTGAVTDELVAQAREKSIELAGKEKLVELIPSCLLEEGLMKGIEDTTAKLIEQAQITKDERAEKEALSEKLKESEDMITKLNDEKTALSEEFKIKEKEHNNLLRKHKYIEKELQKQNEEMSSLVSERNRLQEEIRQLQEKAQDLDEQSAKYKELEEQLPKGDKLLEEERSQRRQLEEKLRQSDKDMEEAMYLTDDLEEKLARKEQELSEKEEALKKLSDQGKLKEAVSGELAELKTNNQILQQSLAEKERALSETGKKEAALATEFKAMNELLDKLREENQQISTKTDMYTKRVITKLQNEVRSYIAEMEDAVFPSLDLRPSADKGVLLKLEPKGPVVTLKNIGTSGVSFESQRKLDIPSSCNTTLIFFGSSNPLTISVSLIWQKKLPGSSMYNIRFKFLSLKPGQSRRINEYINKTRKILSKVKK